MLTRDVLRRLVRLLSLMVVLVVSRSHAGPASAEPSFACDAVTEIPQLECEALVTFYQATGGDGWLYNSGWLVTSTPCSWYGISCVSDRVSGISLSGNRLDGSLPLTLGDLTALTELSLGSNRLSEPIPSEIGHLSTLERLHVGANQRAV